MTMSPSAMTALTAALGKALTRKAVLISIPDDVSLSDLEGLFAGYNAARGLGNDGIKAIASTDMPVARGGKISFDFTANED